MSESQKSARGSALQLRELRKSFGDRTVLQGVDLQLEPGEFVAIVGRSGCGKSTLLRLVAGLDQASKGDVTIDGESTHGLHPDTRIMFQEARLLPWKRVLDNVALGLPDSGRTAAARALEQVGLSDRAHDWPARLSGGQKQRVALARALVHHPRLLLLDEPLGALDALTRLEMQGLIEKLWRRSGFTALLVTHDVQEAVALADRVILIEDGAIALDLRIHLARPRHTTDVQFCAYEQQILERVLQQPGREPEPEPVAAPSAWTSTPAHGLRWAI